MDGFYKTTKEIETALQRTNKALEEAGAQPTEAVLFGGASVLLHHRGTRWTLDIDVHLAGEADQSGTGTLFYQSGVQVVPRSAMLVHPDYAERLVPYKDFGRLSVMLLSPVDIAISKVARGHENDFYDLFNSDLATHFTLDEFRALYREAAYGKEYPDGRKYEGWKKDRGSVEYNLKRAEEIIVRRKLLAEESTLFEERFREMIGDMAEATGHVVTCTVEDWKKFPPEFPRELQVLSYLMLTKQEKTALERQSVRSKPFSDFYWGKLMPSVRHFHDHVGFGLADTPDVLSLSNVLKGWLKMSGWSLGGDRRSKIKNATPTEGVRTLKAFQTLSAGFFRDFDPDKRMEIDQVFSQRPGV